MNTKITRYNPWSASDSEGYPTMVEDESGDYMQISDAQEVFDEYQKMKIAIDTIYKRMKKMDAGKYADEVCSIIEQIRKK